MVCESYTLWYTKQPMGFKRLNTAKWPPVCWLQTMSCRPFRKAFMPIPYKLMPHSCKTCQSFTKVQNGGQWDIMVKSHDGGGGDWADLKMVTKSCIRWIDFLVDSSACSISFWLAAWVCNKHYTQLGAAKAQRQSGHDLWTLTITVLVHWLRTETQTFMTLSLCYDSVTACQACRSSTY